jgi:hypothetical protein
MSRKTRSDSVLGSLPPARQEAIAAYALEHSLAETLAWLRSDGVQSSQAALSVWLSSWRLEQQMRSNEAAVQTLLDRFKLSKPEASPQEIQDVGQAFFNALAIQQQDPKVWAMTQNLQLKRDELELSRDKFQRDTCELFLKWTSDKRAAEIAASNLSHSDKIEALGQAMFGEDWA